MDLKKRIALHLEELWRCLWGWLPSGIGTICRRICYTPLFKNSGHTFRCGPGVCIQGFRHIAIGSLVSLNRYSSLYASRGTIHMGDRVFLGDFSSINANEASVTIGNNVAIGPMTLIQGANHNFQRLDIPIIDQGHSGSKLIIEDNVWIGAHCIILPNVKIGSGAVIAAGAVVSKNVPPNALMAGIPAKVLKIRT